MPLYIQNSLTKKKEEFVPIIPGEIKMYTCGVTVYDDCHVGHARSLFVFDCLKRYLEYRNFSVKLVRNITDVDDKIINRAKVEGLSFDDIRNKYIKNYYRDLKDMEIEKAYFEPLATENVFYMVDHIKQLIEKGSAYEVDGDVYFSVRTFADYGKLSGQSPDEMKTAVRIDKDEKKKDPLDFALWKKAKEGEPSWKSPWGEGRPGWHIECSTMSMRYLRTQELDIHAGGLDLIFPHHENEIAQAEALTGKKFAKYWIHHGLLTIDGKKMSKSLGNFITIQDVLKKYKPDILKLFFLSAHYSSPIDFTFESLEKTKKAYQKIEEFLLNIALLKKETAGTELSSGKDGVNKELIKLRYEFNSVMDDDFNTSKALAVIFELISLGNKYLVLSMEARVNAIFICDLLLELSVVLGLNLKLPQDSLSSSSVKVKLGESSSEKLDSVEIERLVEERKEARKNKDFKRSDEIRDYLKSCGVVIEDREKLG